MSTMKLLRHTLSTAMMSRRMSKQTQLILSRSLRTFNPATSKHCLNFNKGRHCVKSDLAIQASRFTSTEAKFEVMNIQDEEDFRKRVISASESAPIVVDFHATWCGPCKILAPRLESIIGKKNGKVTLAKVDIDDNPDLAMEYGVRSVPTVLAVKNGKPMGQFIGVIDDDQIDSFVEKLIIS